MNPTAEMNDPEDMVVCNAEVTDAVEFTTDNTGGTTTYTWTNDTPAIGLAATGLEIYHPLQQSILEQNQ